MNNREKLKAMTNEELTEFFCNGFIKALEEKCDEANIEIPCKLCPYTELCSYGNPGFLVWLEQKAEETKDAQKI